MPSRIDAPYIELIEEPRQFNLTAEIEDAKRRVQFNMELTSSDSGDEAIPPVNNPFGGHSRRSLDL